MTFKITISVTDEIKEMIDEYNTIHKYAKVQTSSICQDALYNFLINELPKKETKKKNSEISDFEVDSKIPDIEVEKPPKKQIESKEPIKPIEQNKPIQKPIKNQHTFEMTCIECGKQFTAKSKLAKTCSDTCRSAFSRKNRKLKK